MTRSHDRGIIPDVEPECKSSTGQLRSQHDIDPDINVCRNCGTVFAEREKFETVVSAMLSTPPLRLKDTGRQSRSKKSKPEAVIETSAVVVREPLAPTAVSIPLPSIESLKFAAKTAEMKAREANRAVMTAELAEKVPEFYREIARKLLLEAVYDPVAFTKAELAVATVLVWNEAWEDGEVVNGARFESRPVMSWYKDNPRGDLNDSTCSWLSVSGDTIMGKMTERDWVTPIQKDEKGEES